MPLYHGPLHSSETRLILCGRDIDIIWLREVKFTATGSSDPWASAANTSKLLDVTSWRLAQLLTYRIEDTAQWRAAASA